MDGGRTILALVGLLLVLMGILWMIGRIDTVRRSGTATVAIISSLFQPGGGIEGTLQGTHLRYTYVVDGTTYLGADFRRWSDVEAHHPKVCFEPANPANHILVDGRVRCGIDPGP